MSIALIITSILPALVLVGFIIFKDKNNPEPKKKLLIAFGLGMISGPASLLLIDLFRVMGLFSDNPTTFVGVVIQAFFQAAVPEEIMKFLALWIVVKTTKEFDEYFDGIVYAVCVGMGFAALENVLYLVGAGDAWVRLGIQRALLSVPGHYADAVLMGIFFSLAYFGTENVRQNQIYTLLYPILAHGLYDTVCSTGDTIPSWLAILIDVAALAAFIYLQRYLSKRLKTHLQLDQ